MWYHLRREDQYSTPDTHPSLTRCPDARNSTARAQSPRDNENQVTCHTGVLIMSNGAWSPQDPDQEGPKERKEADGRGWVLTQASAQG